MPLIINADDYGMSKSINDAIVELAGLGSVSSVGVMINMPYINNIKELVEIETLGIGLHLNLTQGFPVSEPNLIPSLVAGDGMFYSKKEFWRRIFSGQIKDKHIELEILAQFKLLKSIVGSRLDHIDSHQGILKLNKILTILQRMFSSQPKQFGIRLYKKYYPEIDYNRLISPGLLSVNSFGLRRVLTQKYFAFQASRLEKHFLTTEGFYSTKSHLTSDSLLNLKEANPSLFDNRLFEISCHPSLSKHNLPDTSMTTVRVDEYNLLKNNEIIGVLNEIGLTNFDRLRKKPLQK